MLAGFQDEQLVGPPVAGDPTVWAAPVLTGSGGDGGMNLLADNPTPIDLPSVSPGGAGAPGNTIAGISGPMQTPAAAVGAVGKSINNLSGGSKVFLAAVIVAALLYLL